MMTLTATMLLAATAVISSTSTAAEVQVYNDSDTGPGTLRQAIADASPGDTITFADGVENITLVSVLPINKNLTVDGGGKVTLLLSGTGYLHINVTSGTLTLKGLTLTGLGDGGNNNGGIYSSGKVILEDCNISDCYKSILDTNGNGGALYAGGGAELTNCRIENNIIGGYGGGVNGGYSDITAMNCVFTGNSGLYGGALCTVGNATLINCTFSYNKAAVTGGAIVALYGTTLIGCTLTGNSATNSDSTGGGVYSFTATFTNCTLSGNSASNGGGVFVSMGVALTNCTVNDNKAVVSGGGVFAYGDVVLTNCTVSGNYSSEYGGGICGWAAVTLTNCTVSGNSAGYGGGIFANTRYLQGSIVSGNYAGGIQNEISGSTTKINGDGMLVVDGTGPLGAGSAYYIIGIPTTGGLSSLMEPEPSNIIPGSPDVGKLKDNGGGMLTILPAAGSPMLNAVPASMYAAAKWDTPADQRGVPRPTTGNGTVGALEAISAAPPIITQQPEDTLLILGQTDTPLEVAAVSPDGGTLSYQWYSSPTLSNTGGIEIAGATGSTYTPPATALGDLYYYVVVTNTTTGLDFNENTAVSNAVTVTVDKCKPSLGLSADPPGSMTLPGAVTLTATLSEAYPGVYGLNIVFIVDGVPVGTKAADASGVAVFVLTDPLPGTYSFGASFAGDANNESASADIADYIVTQGAAKRYYITSTSDAWSSVSPKGTVEVQKGADRTFVFSADAGHSISAVLVDGVPLPWDKVGSGEYTFTEVNMNHTIEVRSSLGPVMEYTLTIEKKEGEGYAEYSVNGSPFSKYESSVSLPERADVEVKAYAADGYRFVKWETPALETTPDIYFLNVQASLYLGLYFTEEESPMFLSSDLLLWIVWIVLLLIVAGILIWFIFFYRRSYEVIKAESSLMIVGKERARRKRAYRFMIEGGHSGTVPYRVGEGGEWKTLSPNANGEYIIPKKDVVDKLTIGRTR